MDFTPLTAAEKAQAQGQFALAIERHKRECNRRDLAIEEARIAGQLRRELGVEYEAP